MQTPGSHPGEEKEQQQKKRSPANEECLQTAEQGGGRKEILICLSSPGLISDTNRATGKLCSTEREVRRREGQTCKGERDRQFTQRAVWEEFGGQMFVCVN